MLKIRLKSLGLLVRAVLINAGCDNTAHVLSVGPAVSNAHQDVLLEIGEDDALGGELGEDGAVEDLLGRELAGLGLDEGELDDGREDGAQPGEEGEAREVPLQVVQRRGDLEAEADRHQHAPLEGEVFLRRDAHLRTGEDHFGGQPVRNFAELVELRGAGLTLMARHRQARKVGRYYETCRS